MTTASVEIQGHCAPRFAGVREEFARGFAERDELGASVAIVLNGELVVDLWGGWADVARTRPWERDTIVVVHSVTKAFVSMAVHMLVERGLIDFDAPVVDCGATVAERVASFVAAEPFAEFVAFAFVFCFAPTCSLMTVGSFVGGPFHGTSPVRSAWSQVRCAAAL